MLLFMPKNIFSDKIDLHVLKWSRLTESIALGLSQLSLKPGDLSPEI